MKKIRRNPSSSPAAQLMAVEVITELLVTTSPHRLGEVLTEHLRELSGARTVMVLAYRPEHECHEILTVSPMRRATLFSNVELNLFCFNTFPGNLPFFPGELPPGHPLKVPLARAGIHSMVRYPLAVGGEPVGLMLLFDLPGLDRIGETSQIIHLLLSPIALELKNVLNYRKIKEQAQELELRVKERTSELAAALAETEAARQRVELILESISDGILFTDRHHRVLIMSPCAKNILGFHNDQNFQLPVQETLAGTPLLNQLTAIGAGHRVQGCVEWSFGEKDSEPRICQARSAVVKNPKGEFTGVITLLQDVSRERALDRMKSDFISTAAHELRTPLAAVMGFADLLTNPNPLDEEQRRECLDIIYQNSERLEKIVDELFDLSRIEAGQLLQVRRVPCDLVALLRLYIRTFNVLSSSHGFEQSAPEGPIPVLVDEAKLSRVMDNLLGNAAKFSPMGSLIQVLVRVEDSEVRVTIADEGIGMTPRQIERMFEKFYRADSSNTAKGGLGLGMAIVKSIIEAHDGKIWVNSAHGKGTQVHFTLPLLHPEIKSGWNGTEERL